LYVASDSTATTSTIGELRVRYRVKFTVPILSPNSVVGGVVHFSSIAATTANNFASAVLQAGGTPMLTGITLGTNTIVFPSNIPGNYLITLNVAGATSATAFGAVVNSLPLNLFTQGQVRDTVSDVQSLAGTTTAPSMQLITATVPQSGTTITITASTIVGGGSMDMFIVSLPSTVLTVDEKEQIEIDELRVRADEQDRKIERLMAFLTPQPSSPVLLDGGVDSSGSSSSTSGGVGSKWVDGKEPAVDLEKSIHMPRSLFNRMVGKS